MKMFSFWKVAFFSGCVTLLAASAVPASALSLNDARSQGFVCETTEGLVKATGGGSDVSQLVQQTNAKRMESYRAEAKRQGVSVTDVQIVSAAQLRGKYSPCR